MSYIVCISKQVGPNLMRFVQSHIHGMTNVHYFILKVVPREREGGGGKKEREIMTREL